jgi:drug/metabolite transporter (DMT)-like permease
VHQPIRPGPNRANVAIFFAIALIGGGNPVGVAIVVDELDPLWAAALRFLAAGVIFALATVVLRVPIPHGRGLLGALLYGVFGFFGAFAFLFWGLQETPAGTSQIIIALVPLITLGLAVVHRLERFSLRALVGGLVALSGLAFVLSDRIRADVPLISLLAILAGAVFLAESGIILKLTPRAHPLASNAVGMLGGGALLLVASAFAGDQWVLPTQPDTVAAMTFLILGGSVAVFGLFALLLGRWTVSAVSYSLLLQPLPAIVYAAWLTNEPITPALLVGGTVVVVGVYIGALARTRSTPVSTVPVAGITEVDPSRN